MEVFISLIIILLICGLVAGILAGLFGIGGGIIMVPVMFFLLSSLGYEEYAMTTAVATSGAVILPTTISGTIRYQYQEKFPWRTTLIIGSGGVMGTVMGSIGSVLIQKNLHVIAFACFLLFMAFGMIGKRFPSCSTFHVRGSGPVFLALGIFVGTMASFFGIGGGVILTPVLTILLGMKIHQAIGISLGSMILIASGTVTSYSVLGMGVSNPIPFSLGYINLLFVIILTCTSIPAVQIGVKSGSAMSERTLTILFTFCLIVIALRMAFSAF